MKIILHGATNGTNFGDILFADIFFKSIAQQNPKMDVRFFEFGFLGAGSFLRQELKYNKSFTVREIFQADALVYISGGYFGERDGTIKENLLRFFRYVPLALVFILRKKPLIIAGVGGGPLNNILLRKSMQYLMNKAHSITVRDIETQKYFESYGVSNNLLVTSDTAQIITSEEVPPIDDAVQEELFLNLSDKKIILLHLYGKEEIDQAIINKVIGPINDFIKTNPTYGLVITTDFKFDTSIYGLSKIIEGYVSTFFYNYTSVWQMCAIINKADIIITPKLHVGIIGSTFSKSVISVPMHKEKTARYYKQIGEADRCVSLKDIGSDQLYSMLEYYKDKKIKLSPEIIKLAQENLGVLNSSLKEINEKK